MKKNNRSRSNGSKIEIVVNLLALTLFVGLGVGFLVSAISTHFLPPALTVVLVIVVALLMLGAFLLRRSRRGAVRASAAVIAMVLCLVFALGIGYIRIGLSALNRITATQEPQAVAMSVYVRQGDSRDLRDVLTQALGILSTDQDNTQAAVAKLEQEYDLILSTKPYTSPSELVTALAGNEVEKEIVLDTLLVTKDNIDELYDTLIEVALTEE